jgi:superfamily II DNA/RNA helicase
MFKKPSNSPHSRQGGRSFGRPTFNNSKPRFGSRPAQRGGKRGPKSLGSHDISAFIQKASIRTPEKVVPLKHPNFTDFPLSEKVLANIAKRNYTVPSPIQDQTIEHILRGRDVLGLASTGTGKTAAFLLPLIDKILADMNQKVIVIAPTRELAQQIEDELRQFARGLKLRGAVCVGGMSMFHQINDLKDNPHFVIGTPGRLKDLADRGHIVYKNFQTLVLDEVDHMLDMGFIDPITDIVKALPKDRQTLFFSATMPPKIRTLADAFLQNPIKVEISVGNTAKNVEQEIVKVGDRALKFDILHEILSREESKKVLIFSETKRDVERLANDLKKRGHKAVSIHGDKRQRERERALAQFKDNTASVLVATDVAARGIDVKEITHVINYTIPQSYDDYVHRIGRTGRGSSKGKAMTFV